MIANCVEGKKANLQQQDDSFKSGGATSKDNEEEVKLENEVIIKDKGMNL